MQAQPLNIDSAGSAHWTVERTDYPPLYIAASHASSMGQRRYTQLLRWELVLLLIASALGATWSFVPRDMAKIMAIAVALLLAVAVVLRVSAAGGQFDSAWFDGRVVAEAVKTVTWLFMMRADPYNGTDKDAEQRVSEDLEEIVALGSGLRNDLESALNVSITPRMRVIRALPLRDRRSCYEQDRLATQVNWYTAKLHEHAKAGMIWLWIGWLSQGGALAIAIIGAVLPEALNFVGFFAAAATAATAWRQLRRHHELTTPYRNASNQLAHVERLLKGATREERFQHLIDLSESVIAGEQNIWANKRGI
jgi:uncharacterized membrane protein YbaN (DUF454 family)